MHLNTVQDIERAIDALTPQQIEELYVWLDQRHPQPVDAQLKADLDAGRIDHRINRALADHKARKISGTTITPSPPTSARGPINSSLC
jgi:hypothetical protein